MAYSTDNPPALVASGIGGKGNIWKYDSADALTDARVSGYFSNGYDLGMRAGDMVIITDTDTSATSLSFVNAASATAVDLADGTALTATDTD